MPKKKSDEEFAREVEWALKDPPKFEGLTVTDLAERLNEPVSTNRVHREILTNTRRKTKLYTLLEHRGIGSKQKT
ncbi:MAG: hypothetical protein JRN21_09545 [Nitrososphaerota archaeon]|nr:hypothetical protein [Nitrososphaerota archaeon]